MKGGYWVGAINDHGQGSTSYHLFSAWNINVEEGIVRVLYQNFAKSRDYHIADFLMDTKNAIADWDIEFVWILQDANCHQPSTALPFIQFINHLWKYLKCVNIDRHCFSPVHLGPVLSSILSLVPDLQEILENIKNIIKIQERHEGDPLKNPVFSDEIIADFATVCEEIYQGVIEDPNEYAKILTATIASGAFNIINLIHDRKHLHDEITLQGNTDNIIRIINDNFRVFEDPHYQKSPLKVLQVDILQTLQLYKTTLLEKPFIPFECWILSPEYEVSLKLKKVVFETHYLLDRIKNGCQYPANKFNYWCGSSKFQFIFVGIPINDYEDTLAACLPPITR